MTERAKTASARHTNAAKAWVTANAAAGVIGPRFMQTDETLASYEAAQAALDEAEREMQSASAALRLIPSDEFAEVR